MSNINKPLFYILSFTWGIIYTIAGLLVALFMIVTGHKPKRWGWSVYFETEKPNWGGASWDFIFVRDKTSGSYLNDHEFGHAIQNCFYGPFMIFLVAIPSTLRYHVRRIMKKRGRVPSAEYYSIWFEKQATEIGAEIIRKSML